MEFTIPLTREDLVKNDGRGIYVVSELVSAHELISRIDGENNLQGPHIQYIYLCLPTQNVNPSLLKQALQPLQSVLMYFTV